MRLSNTQSQVIHINLELQRPMDTNMKWTYIRNSEDVQRVFSTLMSCEKFPYSEFFWSVFSRILSECGKIRIKKSANTDTFHAVLYTFHSCSVSRWNPKISNYVLMLNQNLRFSKTDKRKTFWWQKSFRIPDWIWTIKISEQSLKGS